MIPGDGDIVEGIATVDESAITGESAPVIRESGGDRSAVTGGTRVLSDEIVVRITARPGETFLDRMIALVEGADRQKTPNEIALSILLAGLTIIFLLAVVTLQPFAIYSGAEQSDHRARRAARVPDPDDDRRAAVGDRHRRHGPPRAAQRARHVGPRRRGRRRRHHAAARQDRHDHLRLAPGGRVHPGARRRPTPSSPRARWCRRSPTRRRRAARSSSWPIDAFGLVAARRSRRRARAVHRPDPHVGHGPHQRPYRSARAPPTRCAASSRPRAAACRSSSVPIVEQVSRDGATPLVVIDRPAGDEPVAGARRDPPQGHREARHARALRPAARDGHPHRDDHRRQPAHRRGDRRGGRRRRLPRRGDARGQDGADQARAGRRQPRGDDRRRHQRRAGAGPGRRRRGDEHRHAGRQGGRQHGRPRQQPDEADRDRRGRQAAADDPRLADDVLDRQRRRQVLRHHPGDVLGRAAGARRGST